jgi:hypothetical protein
MITVNVIWHAAPGSIWAKLAERIGREPSNAEAAAEVRRILRESADARMVSDPQRHLRRMSR